MLSKFASKTHLRHATCLASCQWHTGRHFLHPGSSKCRFVLRKPPPATEPFRGLRARNPKRVKNESKKSLPGPPVPGAQKVRKESKTSQKGSKRVIFDSFLTLFGLFGPLGPEGLGDSFLTFFFPGPKAPKWLCSWWGLSQGLSCYRKGSFVTGALEPCFKGIWASDFHYVLRMATP